MSSIQVSPFLTCLLGSGRNIPQRQPLIAFGYDFEWQKQLVLLQTAGQIGDYFLCSGTENVTVLIVEAQAPSTICKVKNKVRLECNKVSKVNEHIMNSDYMVLCSEPKINFIQSFVCMKGVKNSSECNLLALSIRNGKEKSKMWSTVLIFTFNFKLKLLLVFVLDSFHNM